MNILNNIEIKSDMSIENIELIESIPRDYHKFYLKIADYRECIDFLNSIPTTTTLTIQIGETLIQAVALNTGSIIEDSITIPCQGWITYPKEEELDAAIISKELLSAVLSEEVVKVDNMARKENFYYFVKNENYPMGEQRRKISIYKLMSLCKRWAKGLQFVVYSSIGDCFIYYSDKNKEHFFGEKGDFEHNRVFKACQFILDTKV